MNIDQKRSRTSRLSPEERRRLSGISDSAELRLKEIKQLADAGEMTHEAAEVESMKVGHELLRELQGLTGVVDD
jgi:hypothetical protein